MGHKYDVASKAIVEESLRSLAITGRERVPPSVMFMTYTLKYNTSHWVTI